jgi:hypothetical protein
VLQGAAVLQVDGDAGGPGAALDHAEGGDAARRPVLPDMARKRRDSFSPAMPAPRQCAEIIINI